jgi:hypothetical protein
MTPVDSLTPLRGRLSGGVIEALRDRWDEQDIRGLDDLDLTVLRGSYAGTGGLTTKGCDWQLA